MEHPVRFIPDLEVARVLTAGVAAELMERTLAAAARGDALGPLRAVVPVPSGWFGAMPASVNLPGLRGLGAKLVTAFPANAVLDKPTHLAVVVLFDPDCGELRAIVGAETITERRTAAVSVVATRRVAQRPRGRLAILGCGVQGRAHFEAFAAAGLIESLSLWSRTRDRAEALARHASEAGLASVSVHATAAGAAREADVIVTATGSSTPILHASDLSEGAHVNAVGACVPQRRELASDLVAASNLYVDSLAGAEAEAGDLLLAAQELGGRFEPAEIGELLADPGRRDASRRFSLFKSLGLGIEDVACAAYALDRIDRHAACA